MQDHNPSVMETCENRGGSGLQQWGSEEVAVLGAAESFPQPSSLLLFSLHRVAMPAFTYSNPVLLLPHTFPGRWVLLESWAWPPGTACVYGDTGHPGQGWHLQLDTSAIS